MNKYSRRKQSIKPTGPKYQAAYANLPPRWLVTPRRGPNVGAPYPPFIVAGGAFRVSASDPAYHVDYDSAFAYAGCSDSWPTFATMPGDGVIVLDLDGATDERGNIKPDALSILRRFPGLWERSKSGTGLHAFLRGNVQLPGGAGKTKTTLADGTILEIFVYGQSVTATGDRLPEAIDEPIDHTDALQSLIDGIYRDRAADEAAKAADRRPPERGNRFEHGLNAPGPCPVGEWEVIAKIRASASGAKFESLWGGSILGYRGRSEADLALCSLLAFWAGGDSAMVDALFRQSGLMRPKWDTRRPGGSYGSVTIDKAIDRQRSFYNWHPSQWWKTSDQGEKCPDKTIVKPQKHNGLIGTLATDGGTAEGGTKDGAEDGAKSEGIPSVADPSGGAAKLHHDDLSPVFYRPFYIPQHPRCYSCKILLKNKQNVQQHRVCGFACGRKDCAECQKTKIDNVSGWFGDLFSQVETFYKLTAGDETEVERLKKRIQRAAKRESDLDWVRFGTADGAVWLVSHPVEGAEAVSGDDAPELVRSLAEAIPDGKRIRSSKRIRMTIEKSEKADEWKAVKEIPPLTKASWERIQAVLARREVRYNVEECPGVGLKKLDFTLPENFTSDDLQALCVEMIDGDGPGLVAQIMAARRRPTRQHVRLCGPPVGQAEGRPA